MWRDPRHSTRLALYHDLWISIYFPYVITVVSCDDEAIEAVQRYHTGHVLTAAQRERPRIFHSRLRDLQIIRVLGVPSRPL